jgi:hypothetical protein
VSKAPNGPPDPGDQRQDAKRGDQTAIGQPEHQEKPNDSSNRSVFVLDRQLNFLSPFVLARYPDGRWSVADGVSPKSAWYAPAKRPKCQKPHCVAVLVQISEFPTGDFGSNRQAVSVETDRSFRSKAAPRCEWVLVPALANRRCVIHPILLWPAKASTLVIIIVSNDCCGRL